MQNYAFYFLRSVTLTEGEMGKFPIMFQPHLNQITLLNLYMPVSQNETLASAFISHI